MPQQPHQHDQKGCQCSCFELVEVLKAPNHQRFLATNLNAIRLGSAPVPGVTLPFLASSSFAMIQQHTKAKPEGAEQTCFE